MQTASKQMSIRSMDAFIFTLNSFTGVVEVDVVAEWSRRASLNLNGQVHIRWWQLFFPCHILFKNTFFARDVFLKFMAQFILSLNSKCSS